MNALKVINVTLSSKQKSLNGGEQLKMSRLGTILQWPITQPSRDRFLILSLLGYPI